MNGEGAYLSAVVPFGYSEFTGEGLLPLYREMGCRSVQVQRHPEADPPASELRSKTENAGLRIDSLHGRFGSHLDPSSPHRAVRDLTRQVAMEDAEYVAALGGAFVVLHPSAGGTVTGSLERQKRLIDFLGDLEDSARDLGVRFLLENLPPSYPLGGHAGDLLDVLQEVQSEWFGLILDTGHANMADDPGQQIALMMSGGICAMHVHDNQGSLDNHQWPGEGSVDWSKIAAHTPDLPEIPLAVEVFPSESELARRVQAGGGVGVRNLLGLSG
ncbi:MAG: sugar phosphate isomerase/epimerase family protein [Phycisphaeraceae bacterium]